MTKERLVVIGNGMAGCRAVEELLKRAPDRYQIAIFGAEPRVNYNRIMLSPVLAGEKAFDDIVINDEAWYRDHGITLHSGRAVTAVDREAKVVRAEGGLEVAYDRLILATGSDPVRLPLPGADLAGVVTFRDLDDVEAMVAAARPGARAVVIGGGLLGLEAAYEGAWGNALRARVDHATAGPDVFNLSVRDMGTGDTETHRNLSVDSAHPRYVLNVLRNESRLMRTFGGIPGARPAASAAPNVAITVSPAPVTSNTSRASVGRCSGGWFGASRVMPFSLRVTSKASMPSSSRSFVPLATIVASSGHGPTTASSSDRFGVISVAPRYGRQSLPFGSTSTGRLRARASAIIALASASVPLP